MSAGYGSGSFLAPATGDGPLRRGLDRAGTAALGRIPHERAGAALVRRWRAATHLGRRVRCPLCGWSYARFRDDWNRPNAVCWRCGAHERHRAIWLFLAARPALLDGARSLLHFAPEWALERRLRARRGLHYLTADLEPGNADLALDLTRLDLPDAAFDAVICSHVLEHVDDDRAAMRELRRVLTPGGWALVLVPVDHGRERTYEDASITAPADRQRAFWQPDHVRLYGTDVAGRLAEAGMDVTVHRVADAAPASIAHHGLSREDVLFLCRPGYPGSVSPPIGASTSPE